jgi:COMPASS component BRE2
MASDVESPKREATPTAPLSSIPQKRALDEGHSPAVSSPLNPEGKSTDIPTADDTSQLNRSKSARAKKESFKKREAKGADSVRATPDPKAPKEPEQSESGPLRYKLAPPKASDFDPPRGPVLTLHHEVTSEAGDKFEFYETSEQ